MLTFLPQGPGANPLKAAWRLIEPDIVRVAMAFASEAGVHELRGTIVGAALFDAPEKQSLIGIQDGVTQPKALEKLGSLRGSEARVPYGAAAIADGNLKAPVFFHPKIYYLENSASGEVAIVSTSANLTLSGLRSNVEQMLVWRGVRGDAEAEELNVWWDRTWPAADPATKGFIAAYEARRPRLPLRRPPATRGPADSVLRKASVFWVELTRKPEGGAYNQVELLFSGHFFFYPGKIKPSKATARRLSFEDRRGNVYADKGRQVTFNGPPRRSTGNSMWRVYLPTLAMGFGEYQDGDVLVRFERTGLPDRYIVDVAASNSPLALAWIEASTVAEYKGRPPRRMGWA